MEKKKNIVDLVAFYLMSITPSYFGELIILGIFKGYSYKPGIFSDYFADDINGHILTNAGLWCALAVPVGAFQLGYRWMFLIAISFMGIEELFIAFGLYEHYWWKTYLTGLAVFPFYIITRKWYSLLNEKRRGFIR